MSNNNHNLNKIIDEVNYYIIINSLSLQEGTPILSVEVNNYVEESLNDEEKITCQHYLYSI